MIRVRFERPVMRDAVAEIETALDVETVALDEFQALFNGPIVLEQKELGRIARRVNSLVEVTVVGELECVELDAGDVWRVEGGKWMTFRGHA